MSCGSTVSVVLKTVGGAIAASVVISLTFSMARRYICRVGSIAIVQDRARDVSYLGWRLTPIYDPDPLSEGVEGIEDDIALLGEQGADDILQGGATIVPQSKCRGEMMLRSCSARNVGMVRRFEEERCCCFRLSLRGMLGSLTPRCNTHTASS